MTDTIHSCGDFCQLPACVSARSIKQIREALAAFKPDEEEGTLYGGTTDFYAFADACNPAAMTAFIAEFDAMKVSLDAAEKDAARYNTLALYLISTRTDLDDAIVASESKEALDAVIDAAMAQGVKP